MSKLMNLENCTREVVERLQRAGIYTSNADFYIEGSRLFFNRDGVVKDRFPVSDLEKVFDGEEVRSSAFYDLGVDNKKATSVASVGGMMWRKGLGKFVAANWPEPTSKNCLYQWTGVQIEDPRKTTISPNVAMEYIYPWLVSIGGEGTQIGEGAMINAHNLGSNRFIIGYTEIGKGCEVGVRSILWPGAKIGDGAKVQSGAVISAEVEPGRIIPPNGVVTYSSKNR